MTSNLPAQAFGIGQRVRTKAGLDTFAVARIFLNYHGEMRYGAGFSSHSYSEDELVPAPPAPERPPYVPSERRIVDREPGRPAIHSHLTALYRCETDAELTYRHAFERAEYDQHPEFDEVTP